MKPIFLFSLPRSGSTLIQRILSTHKEISTTAEPWILLPYLYTLKEKGIYSEYAHNITSTAINDFCLELPKGKTDYLDSIRKFSLDLYQKASIGNSKYFLDKTPRYHLIIDDIFKLFPDSKKIILWRHPLSVAASIMETWAKGKWNLYGYKIDLFRGINNLTAAYEKHQSDTFSCRYEDVIDQPASTLKDLFYYLDLSFDSDVMLNFSHIELKGRYGDRAGIEKYKTISNASLDQWKATMNNPIRKRWSLMYLNWIGNDRLNLMGYNLNELRQELKTIPVGSSRILSDFFRIFRGILHCTCETRIIKDKFRYQTKWHNIYRHT